MTPDVSDPEEMGKSEKEKAAKTAVGVSVVE